MLVAVKTAVLMYSGFFLVFENIGKSGFNLGHSLHCLVPGICWKARNK